MRRSASDPWLDEDDVSYLQLDVNGRFDPDAKQRLASRLVATYASTMTVDARRIGIAIRECGDGAVRRTVDGSVVPVLALMCDIRRRRPAALRLDPARRPIADCVELLGLRADRLDVEVTQHDGDEMSHPTLGGFSPHWSPDEA